MIKTDKIHKDLRTVEFIHSTKMYCVYYLPSHMYSPKHNTQRTLRLGRLLVNGIFWKTYLLSLL